MTRAPASVPDRALRAAMPWPRPPSPGDGPPSDRTLELVAPVRGRDWVVEGGSLGRAVTRRLCPGQALVVGSGPSAGLRLDDRAVSGTHCRITVSDAGIQVVDLGSTNGLLVGAARVELASWSGDGGALVVGRSALALRPATDDDRDAELEVDPLPGLVGSSAPMLRLAALVRRLAPLRAPVLVRGETGTGKDLVARALHSLSGRTGAFVPLNVGAVTESLADAELFGHRRGSFTGAVASRAGAFQQADAGTLFLDEIAELPAAMQVRLLRVAEDGVVRAVGDARGQRVDVRLVAATWADLNERVSAGRFRMDLLQRLAVTEVQLPPLRARRTDIPLIARGLLARFADELGPRQLTLGAESRLLSHAWPGNVRELGSELYRAALESRDQLIREDAFRHLGPPGLAEPRGRRMSVADARAHLQQHGGNVSAAARAAGVARTTYRGWLAEASGRLAEAGDFGAPASSR